jgi:hypothetical protein
MAGATSDLGFGNFKMNGTAGALTSFVHVSIPCV